ncbi:carboxymuconolactone decarboxylase family protein [Dactylosporangium sp. NPDC049525]|uniref:carboxymuconolactone decarboxylase family protein n=1 Tax=Dactylosporangium sp. NPDC049525 TaxID=3154730 RepID=UPI003434099C
MAKAPTLVNAFVAVSGQFGGTRFTGGERQVLLLSNAVANRCAWAVAFHSTMALKEGVEPGDVDAVRHPFTARCGGCCATMSRSRRSCSTGTGHGGLPLVIAQPLASCGRVT